MLHVFYTRSIPQNITSKECLEILLTSGWLIQWFNLTLLEYFGLQEKKYSQFLEYCQEILENGINIQSCLEILAIASKFGEEVISEKYLSFAVDNFAQLKEEELAKLDLSLQSKILLELHRK